MQNDLKPCPLCGCRAEVVEIECYPDTNRMKIACYGCGLELDHTQEFMIHKAKDPFTGEVIEITRFALNESTVDIWNRRVNNDAM